MDNPTSKQNLAHRLRYATQKDTINARRRFGYAASNASASGQDTHTLNQNASRHPERFA